MSEAIPSKGRLGGIDFGTVRVGVAITDPDRVLASPHETYQRRTPALDESYFQQLAREERLGMKRIIALNRNKRRGNAIDGPEIMQRHQ